MPKMFVHTPKGTLSVDARAAAAAELTDLGMSCERLADTDKVRQGVWVFFSEHDAHSAFSGGAVAVGPLMVVVVYALQGGLDEASKTRLINETTAILGRHAGLGDAPAPVYVVIRETPETDWGMYGSQVSLGALRGDG